MLKQVYAKKTTALLGREDLRGISVITSCVRRRQIKSSTLTLRHDRLFDWCVPARLRSEDSREVVLLPPHLASHAEGICEHQNRCERAEPSVFMISESCAHTPPLHASFTQITTQLQSGTRFDVTRLTVRLTHTYAHLCTRQTCFVTDDRRKTEVETDTLRNCGIHLMANYMGQIFLCP